MDNSATSSFFGRCVSDDLIEQLRAEASADGDLDQVVICDIALHGVDYALATHSTAGDVLRRCGWRTDTTWLTEYAALRLCERLAVTPRRARRATTKPADKPRRRRRAKRKPRPKPVAVMLSNAAGTTLHWLRNGLELQVLADDGSARWVWGEYVLADLVVGQA